MQKFIFNFIISNKNLKLLSGFLLLCVLVLIYIIFSTRNDESNNRIIHDSKSYFFTNPILDCEAFEQGEESIIFRKDLLNKVEDLKENYDTNFVSVYFRDLNNGPWLGINEKEYFVPASLLKTPLVMSLFRYAQDKPSVLSENVFINRNDIDGAYPQKNTSASLQLEEGQEYTLEEVGKRTIIYSDNKGVPILLKHVPNYYIDDIYSSIGGLSMKDDVRVKDYASFFRLLYNASYLNRDMSERLLKIFSEVEYKTGIASGVPKNIVVAHKFGEFTKNEASSGALELTSTEVQLHDCGIVYYPDRPYILCVMTRGSNFKNQEKVIQEISKFVYDAVEENRK